MKQQHIELIKKELEIGIKENFGSGNELFLVSSGKVIVTDPCYDKVSLYNTTLDNVAKGWWSGDVVQAKLDKLGHRICELEVNLIERHPSYLADKKDDITIHEGNVLMEIRNSDEWELEHDNIGVDSGQAGFFDADYFKDEKVVSKKAKREIKRLDFVEPNEQWYGMSCAKTLSTAGWGVIPFGAVSQTGFGDGVYTLYVKRFFDEIVAMKIIFIPVKITEIEER